MKKSVYLMIFLILGFASCNSKSSSDNNMNNLIALASGAGTWSDNGNGTITSPSAQIWMKCAVGQVWDGALNQCSGTGGYTTYGAKSYTYCTDTYCYDVTSFAANSGPAYDACNTLTLAGYSWRLPTRYELTLATTNLTYDQWKVIFPQTPDDKYFWSSTTDSSSKDSAVGVSFAKTSYGTVDVIKKTTPLYIRCIKK
jgi:hypothetical protein